MSHPEKGFPADSATRTLSRPSTCRTCGAPLRTSGVHRSASAATVFIGAAALSIKALAVFISGHPALAAAAALRICSHPALISGLPELRTGLPVLIAGLL